MQGRAEGEGEEVTVKRLIELLSACPQELDVLLYYDSAPRLVPDAAYIDLVTDYETNEERETLIIADGSDHFSPVPKWVFNESKARVWE